MYLSQTNKRAKYIFDSLCQFGKWKISHYYFKNILAKLLHVWYLFSCSFYELSLIHLLFGNFFLPSILCLASSTWSLYWQYKVTLAWGTQSIVGAQSPPGWLPGINSLQILPFTSAWTQGSSSTCQEAQMVSWGPCLLSDCLPLVHVHHQEATWGSHTAANGQEFLRS